MHSDTLTQLHAVRLSQKSPGERARLLKCYEATVYAPAFPDAEIREDPAYWLSLLDADPYPVPPQPKIEVILLVADDGSVAGGATIELYRTAGCGLLTYLSIHAERRGQGLGKRLVAEARAALERMAGGPALMFGETERLEDAQDEAERTETILRQSRLSGLGAKLVDFDYIMPPLRADTLPHRLHLMVFGDPPQIAGKTVLALLDELARALETNLLLFDDTRDMAEFLAKDPPLAIRRLPAARPQGRESEKCHAPDREFGEVAIFRDLDSAAVTFAFELVAKPANTKNRHRTAYRLLALSEALKEEEELHELLVEPVRSFLDDVTNGPPGVNGRPLLFLASGADPGDPSRHVTLVRPRHWTYEYEGRVTQLNVPDYRLRTEMQLRDSFSVFESGRIYYVLTLICPVGATLDEYAAIHFEQLVLERERAEQPDYLGFEWAGMGRLSLLGLVNARLESLRRAPVGSVLNGIKDILKPYGLMSPAQIDERIDRSRIANLCVAIEHEALFATAEHTYALFDRTNFCAPPPPSELVASADNRWGDTTNAVPPDELHAQEDNSIPRSALVIAGLATGVPDFPWQDDSEVHDSTRATERSTEGMLFTHPRFMLEIGKSWRSFRECGDDLGTCPYLLMTWLVCVHDEQTVAEMEQMLEEMIYDPAGTLDKLPKSQRFRAEPLADVMELLKGASSPWGQKTGVQERNLTKRLQLFRWESIHRCGDMFRYPKEKEALAAIREATGTAGRFDEVHETLDRLENLVEDVESLASSYAERRTNRLLAALAVLGLVGIPGNLDLGYLALTGAHKMAYASVTTVIVALLFILYFLKHSGGPKD